MASAEQVYQSFRARGGYLDLSHKPIWRLTGPDAERYLQGQVSNDVSRATESTAIYAAICNAKGMMQGDVRIWRIPAALQNVPPPKPAEDDEDSGDAADEPAATGGAGFFLTSMSTEKDSLHERLERYLIADDARLELIDDYWSLIHLAGPPSAQAEKFMLEGGATVACNRLALPGVDLLLPRARMNEQLQRLNEAGLVQLKRDIHQLVRIERGVPVWGKELHENILPPEAGLDANAIDYAKGCYIGQETISRMKSAGKLRRRLCGLVAVESQPVNLIEGQPLYAEPQSEKAIGEITSTAWSFARGGTIALAYLKSGHDNAATIVWAGSQEDSSPASRVAATVHDLPLVDYDFSHT